MAFFNSAGQTNQQQPVAQNTQSQTPNVDKLPAEVKTQAMEHARPTLQLLEKATQHRPEFKATPGSQGDNKEALMQNQSAQSKTQEALSPTDAGKGVTQSQQRSQGRSRGMER